MRRGVPLAVVLAAGRLASAQPGDEVLVPGLAEIEALERRAPAPPEESEETLIYSATRVPVPLAEAPSTITILTADDLEGLGARTLVDALRGVPELDITRDLFGFWHVAVRGRRNDVEVLVLLDGQPLNDFYDGRILYDVPTALIDRIEILRGPGSALYGTNAFAGVISVFSRRGPGNRAVVMTGTTGGDRDAVLPGMLQGGAHGFWQPLPSLSLGATVEALATRGPLLFVLEDSLTRNRFDPDTGESQSLTCNARPEACPDSAVTSARATVVRLAARADARSRLAPGDVSSLQLHAIHQDRGTFIGEFDTFGPDSDLETSRLLARIGYEVPALSERLRITLLGSVDLARVARLVQIAPDGFKELVAGSAEPFPEGQLKSIRFDELRLGQEVRLQARFPAWNVLTVGAIAEHMTLDYELLTNYDESLRWQPTLANHLGQQFVQDGRSRTVLGLYAEDVLRLPLGLRAVLAARVDGYSDFGTAFSPRAALLWRRGPATLKLFYGEAFRAPTFEELYDRSNSVQLGGFVGNAELDASRLRTVETGGDLLLTRGEVLLTFRLTGFYSSILDSIDRAPVAGLSNPFLNSSDVDTIGLAGEIVLGWRRRLTVSANASWFEATSTYAYVDSSRGLSIRTESELTSVPGYRLNGRIEGSWGRARAGALLEIGAGRRNDRRTPLEELHSFDYPPYHLIHAYLGLAPLVGPLDGRLVVENVTDQEVADPPIRGSRMPQGIPRERLRIAIVLSAML